MRIGIFPGSFDPITFGHIDIAERARKICDKLLIASAVNISKKPLFSIEERLEMIEKSCNYLENIEIVTFNGLLADFCKERNVNFIAKGLRPGRDFDRDYAEALVNRKLAPDVETIFFVSGIEYSNISSTIVRELAAYKGDVSSFVHPFVNQKITEKFSI